jgi:hypothetical protein
MGAHAPLVKNIEAIQNKKMTKVFVINDRPFVMEMTIIIMLFIYYYIFIIIFFLYDKNDIKKK